MKRIFLFLAVLAASIAQAANPTVTTTYTKVGDRARVYSFSFTTAIDAADTAIIGNAAGSWIDVDGAGSHPSDSLITIELKSTETTADSIRQTVWLQWSSATSPTMTAALGASGTVWFTAPAADATTFTNTANGAAIVVAKIRRAGNATKFRLLIGENDTDKDAVQTISGRIVIPAK